MEYEKTNDVCVEMFILLELNLLSKNVCLMFTNGMKIKSSIHSIYKFLSKFNKHNFETIIEPNTEKYLKKFESLFFFFIFICFFQSFFSSDQFNGNFHSCLFICKLLRFNMILFYNWINKSSNSYCVIWKITDALLWMKIDLRLQTHNVSNIFNLYKYVNFSIYIYRSLSMIVLISSSISKLHIKYL